jgi:hypothetical protein
MAANNDATIDLTVPEAAETYSVLKSREETLSSAGSIVLAKLEKFLYDTLSIDDMERLLRQTSR